MQRTWIELDQHTFNSNIAQLAKVITPAPLALVIKSNAYGHGIAQVAHLAQQNTQVSWLCTAGLQEALYVRKNCSVTKPILALSYLDDNLEDAAQLSISCVVYTPTMAQDLSQAALRAGKTIAVHIKIDTGMSRLGIPTTQALDFIHAVIKLPGLIFEGIFTHLADPTDHEFSTYQLRHFNHLLTLLDNYTLRPPLVHILSSSGLALKQAPFYTLVRVGALAYGLHKSPEHQALVRTNYPDLVVRPLLTWKSSIAQIKQIPKNSFIGYNCTYKTEQDSTIALLPVGYYDGYPRALSNKSHVVIKGQKAPVVGIISMNLLAIDITHIPDVTYNDHAVLLGPGIDLVELGYQAHSIPNECATRLCSSIKRIVISQEQQEQSVAHPHRCLAQTIPVQTHIL